MGVMIWEGLRSAGSGPECPRSRSFAGLARRRPRLRESAGCLSAGRDYVRGRWRGLRGSYATARSARRPRGSIAHRNDKMTMRQIGELIAVGFAEERHKINRSSRDVRRVSSAALGVMPCQDARHGYAGRFWPVGNESRSISGRVTIGHRRTTRRHLDAEPSSGGTRNVATRSQRGVHRSPGAHAGSRRLPSSCSWSSASSLPPWAALFEPVPRAATRRRLPHSSRLEEHEAVEPPGTPRTLPVQATTPPHRSVAHVGLRSSPLRRVPQQT